MSTTLATRNTQLPAQPETSYTRPVFVPRFDLWEGDSELLLYGDLPGVSPEDLEIRFEKRELTIHGKVAARQDDVRYLHQEYGVGDFRRSFTIGELIDAEQISAELRHGVLTIHLPKSDKAKPRRIEVQAE